MHNNYINTCICRMCTANNCTLKRNKRLHSLFPHRDTHMQWTQKHGQGISQLDPYHHLPCKAHLTGRPAAQTSAIFTHFLSCIRSPHLHLVCKALWQSETKRQKTKYSDAPREGWNHSILNTVWADEQRVSSVATTPTPWNYVQQC